MENMLLTESLFKMFEAQCSMQRVDLLVSLPCAHHLLKNSFSPTDLGSDRSVLCVTLSSGQGKRMTQEEPLSRLELIQSSCS